MSTDKIELKRIEDYLWEIPCQGGMRVPGRIFANETLMATLREDNSLRQVMNVAHLPGIVGYSRYSLGLRISDRWCGGYERR